MGGDAGGVLVWEDGVLTGLKDGVLDRDLTTGAGDAAAASVRGPSCSFSVSFVFFTGPFPGLPTSFSIISTLVSGPFSFNFFGSAIGLFSISILVSISIFLSLTTAFDSIFDFGSLVNGKTTGTNFLFVMPSGVPLIHFSNLGVFGSSIKVLSLSASTSNESSGLAKIPAANVSGFVLYLADQPFYKVYPVCGMEWGLPLGTDYLAIL